MTAIDSLRSAVNEALVADADRADLPDIGIAIHAMCGAAPRIVEARQPDDVTQLLRAAGPFATETDRDLLDAIAGAATLLHWRAPYPEHDEGDMVRLRAGYFVAALIGPPDLVTAPFASTSASIFLTVQAPGSWIVHPTGTRHAMATGDQPMVAMAIWTDDLDSRPVIVRD